MDQESFKKVNDFIKGLEIFLELDQDTIVDGIKSDKLPFLISHGSLALCIKSKDSDFTPWHNPCYDCPIKILSREHCKNFRYDKVRDEYKKIRQGGGDVNSFIQNVKSMKSSFENLRDNWDETRNLTNRISNAKHYIEPHGTYVKLDEL